MVSVQVHQYNAFSTEPDKGNPAGVVLDGNAFTEEQMLGIAKQIGFNETVFVLKSDVAKLRLRYFTPGHEINLCGHATIASVFALVSRGSLTDTSFSIETNVGLLPIQVTPTAGGPLLVTMRQAAPEFVPFEGSIDDLAASIGLTSKDIDENFPIVYGSTGIWTLLVPIRNLESFTRMVPRNDQFPKVLQQMPRMSVHPFCTDTYDPKADMHARHFSSPYSGTVEDPVTGTASGVMGAYYKKYVRPNSGAANLVIEQGNEIGKNGNVFVSIDSNMTKVEITGSGVYVTSFDVTA